MSVGFFSTLHSSEEKKYLSAKRNEVIKFRKEMHFERKRGRIRTFEPDLIFFFSNWQDPDMGGKKIELLFSFFLLFITVKSNSCVSFLSGEKRSQNVTRFHF